MKVCIFGVGRSGTSAIYSLLQKIMNDQLEGGTDFVYEPFLWDRDVFNGPYEAYAEKFPYLDSLSAEGMFYHQKLPLFMESPDTYRHDPFLTSLLTPAENRSHLLLKSIRMNGRFEVLRACDPEAKFIFVLRNPIDVVNSVIRIFSFFGKGFHRDDFPRFKEDILRLYGEVPAEDDAVRQSAAYWLYMNRFVVDRLPGHTGILTIPHEYYISKRQEAVSRICEFLGLECRDSYVDASARKVGALTGSVNLTRREYETLHPMLAGYDSFLKALGFANLPLDTLEQKYMQGTFREISAAIATDGFTANQLSRKLNAKKSALDTAAEENSAQVLKLQGRLDRQKEQLQSLRGHLDQLKQKHTAKVEEMNSAAQAQVRQIQDQQLRIQADQKALTKINEKLLEARNKIERLTASRSYRLGRMITRPISWTASLFGGKGAGNTGEKQSVEPEK